MTIDEIRQNPVARASIAATLSDEWMMRAFLALEQSIPVPVPLNAEAIVSVRAKAFEDGQRAILEKLNELIRTPEEPQPDPVPTWNSGLSQEEAAVAEQSI